MQVEMCLSMISDHLSFKRRYVCVSRSVDLATLFVNDCLYFVTRYWRLVIVRLLRN